VLWFSLLTAVCKPVYFSVNTIPHVAFCSRSEWTAFCRGWRQDSTLHWCSVGPAGAAQFLFVGHVQPPSAIAFLPVASEMLLLLRETVTQAPLKLPSWSTPSCSGRVPLQLPVLPAAILGGAEGPPRPPCSVLQWVHSKGAVTCTFPSHSSAGCSFQERSAASGGVTTK